MTLTTVALGMAWSLWIIPARKDVDSWWIAPDVWVAMRASHYVADGALGYVYEANEFFVNLPGFAILLAPLAWLGRALGLTESIPFTLARPSMWLVYGPLGMALSALVFSGGANLSATAARLGRAPEGWRRAGFPDRSSGTLQAALVPLVALPVAGIYGHYEDLIALACALAATRIALTGRFVRAALVLSVGIACKQWAVLALPLLIALSPAADRRRVFATGMALPFSLAAFTLAVDWHHASAALFSARTFPQLGHASLWSGLGGATVVGSPLRALVIPVAAAMAWRLRGETAAPRILAGLALIFLTRLVFEPVVYAYYLAPFLTFAAVHERVTTGRVRTVAGAGTALMLWFPLHPPAVMWWPVALALTAVAARRAWVDVFMSTAGRVSAEVMPHVDTAPAPVALG